MNGLNRTFSTLSKGTLQTALQQLGVMTTDIANSVLVQAFRKLGTPL